MVVTRGKRHNFVGMDLEFMNDGTVQILMQDYIKECFEAFGEVTNRVANTPGKHSLFEVTESLHLSKEKMEIFHHIVAKLLYVSKRARVDIDLMVSFLCTRVSKSTEED